MINKLNKPVWEKIETVLLDMDGTLLDLHYDNHFWLKHVPQRYAEKNCMTHEEANQYLLKRYGEVRGSLDWYCMDFWSHHLDLDIEKLKNEVIEKISIREDVIDFLQWLNNKQKRVVLVTNAHPNSVKIKMKKTKLNIHFDNIINAHDIGLAKEDEDFWQEMQKVEAYKKENTILIDDNFDVLASAKNYGIAYCYGILQPDSQGGSVVSKQFHVLDSLKHILPI